MTDSIRSDDLPEDDPLRDHFEPRPRLEEIWQRWDRLVQQPLDLGELAIDSTETP